MQKAVFTLAAAVLLAAGPMGQSWAATPTGPQDVVNLDFSKAADQGKVMLNGTDSAAFTNGRLELVDGNGSESSSAFITTPFQVSDYLATFDFEIKSNPDNSNPPADAFMFVAQTAGPDHIGGGGGGGYARTDIGGLPDPSDPTMGFPGYSYAIEFNSWQDQGLPDNPTTVALDLNGNRSKIGITPFNPIDKGVLHAELRVTPAQLAMTVTKQGDTKPMLTFTSPSWLVNFFNAPKPLYFGFTGATGGAVETADVLNFRIQTGVPEPAGGTTTAGATTAGTTAGTTTGGTTTAGTTTAGTTTGSTTGGTTGQ